MKRKSGYYWVFYIKRWFIAEFDVFGDGVTHWEICGNPHYKIRSDGDFKVIIETPIPEPNFTPDHD